MALMGTAQASLQGIPDELKNNIYGLVADDASRKPVILGRKVAQAAKQFLFDGDIRDQALSAIVQHPLEMTCHQIRGEFQAGFSYDYARSQTFEFVVDNFDFEQLKLFEELQYAKYGSRLAAVKSRSQIMRDRRLTWLSGVSFTLRFQMDQNVVASATALAQFMKLCREGRECYSNMPNNYAFSVVHNFDMSFRNRDLLTGVVDHAETMTVAQATQAFEVLRQLRKDGEYQQPMIFNLLVRFTGLVDAHSYHESQDKDHFVTLAAKWQL